MKLKFLAVSLLALLATPAMAADLFSPNAINSAIEDAPGSPWTGVYIGGFGGYSKSTSDVDLGPYSIDGLGLDGGYYGGTLGADLQLSNRIVIGVFGEYGLTNSDFTVGLGGTELKVETDDQWSLGARGGVLITPLTLAYVEGGYSRLSVKDPTFGGSPIPGGAIGDLDGYFIGWNNGVQAEPGRPPLRPALGRLALKLSGDKKVADLARKADLCPGTIRNLRRPPNQGGTMFPRMQTILKILSAADATLEVVKDGQIIRKWN